MRPAVACLLAALSTLSVAFTLGLTSTRRLELLELASLGLILEHALFFVVALAYGLRHWPRARWTALAPTALLVSAVPLVPRVRDFDRQLVDWRFSRHFAAFEVAAERFELAPGDVLRPRPEELPANSLCCYRVLVRRSPANELSAMFMVGPRLAYLYDPSGSAWSDGVGARWRDREHLGTDWYRLAR